MFVPSAELTEAYAEMVAGDPDPRHSETQEWLVIYRARYGECALWVRPYAMFVETVLHDGHVQPRFARVPSPDAV